MTTPAGYDGPSLRSLAATVDASGTETLAVTTPLSGDVVAEVPACQPADVRAAAERARDAQDAWADRPVAERVDVVEEFLSLVWARQDALLDVVQLESGKSRFDAHEELLDVVVTGGFYADRAAAFLASDRVDGALPFLTEARVHHHPYGVVGYITPWNYPLTLTISDAIPALLAGNTVLLKPAEQTPFTALFVARLLVEAGLPADCIHVLPGVGERLGEPLVGSVDCVSFTGSTAAGREVAALAGRELVPATLELGGSGPMLVRADAPLGRAVTGALRGAFASAGQLCIATERIYVHESQYEAFRDRFADRAADLSLGTTFAFGPDVGPLISPTHLAKVTDHVTEAVDAGATLVTGGRRRPDVAPTAYEPTVLTDVPAGTTLAEEETFGPVVAIEPVPDDETAVERANDSAYGLHGSVWTGDREAGRALARRVECGTVSVNDAYAAMWGSTEAPMGGRKDSGVGRRHGEVGFRKYTETQSVTLQRGHPLAGPSWLPNRVTAPLLRAFVRAARALGWR